MYFNFLTLNFAQFLFEIFSSVLNCTFIKDRFRLTDSPYIVARANIICTGVLLKSCHNNKQETFNVLASGPSNCPARHSAHVSIRTCPAWNWMARTNHLHITGLQFFDTTLWRPWWKRLIPEYCSSGDEDHTQYVPTRNVICKCNQHFSRKGRPAQEAANSSIY